MGLRDKLGLVEAPPSPSLLQVFDALILCDAPVLDQRFQEAIAMHPDARIRAVLAALPQRVAEGSRMTRRAGAEWERVTRASVLDDELKEHAERFLLEALLDSAESQIRLKSFLASQAPTQSVRAPLDEALAIHHELTKALRDALLALSEAPAGPARDAAAPAVGLERADRSIRSQVEDAIRGVLARGKKPRVVLLSANALRHLRDHGALGAGATTLLDVPVQVDFSWPGSAFAVLSYDSVPLEEIVNPPEGQDR